MSDFSLVIYTHTDFLELWKIIPYSLKKLNISLPIILLCDNKEPYINLYDFSDIIQYDDNVPYTSRLLSCLAQIKEEYILLIHENTILTRFDNDKINIIKKYVESSELTRVHLSIDHSGYNVYENRRVDKNSCRLNKIILDNNIILTSANGYYHYSVGPSIWNKEKLYSILKEFPNKSYRDVEETKEMDNYMDANGFNICYLGFNPEDTIIYSMGRNMLSYFSYAHITGQRKVVPTHLLGEFEEEIYIMLDECAIIKDDFFKLNFNK